MVKNKYFFFYLNSVIFIMLINFKLLTIVDSLTFMSQINLSSVEYEKSFITSRPEGSFHKPSSRLTILSKCYHLD